MPCPCLFPATQSPSYWSPFLQVGTLRSAHCLPSLWYEAGRPPHNELRPMPHPQSSQLVLRVSTTYSQLILRTRLSVLYNVYMLSEDLCPDSRINLYSLSVFLVIMEFSFVDTTIWLCVNTTTYNTTQYHQPIDLFPLGAK